MGRCEFYETKYCPIWNPDKTSCTDDDGFWGHRPLNCYNTAEQNKRNDPESSLVKTALRLFRNIFRGGQI